jgi:uncharacterized membrane protein YbaN (DUF454 family)
MRLLYFSLGMLFLAIGIAGIILPLMPGTVNLLIAAFFFAKSSPRMEAWMLNHRVIGPPILAWRTDRSMARKHKVLAITMMWCGIGLSILFAPWYAGVCSVLLGIYGTWYIATRPTRKEPLPETVAVPESA